MPVGKNERHRTERIGWLRAAVLGANDGILSTSSLVLGVAAPSNCRTMSSVLCLTALSRALQTRQTPFSLGSAQICFVRLAQQPAVITVVLGSMNNFRRHVLPHRSPELL
jgi:hypothetical protein